MSTVTDRVDIRALTKIAREVFDCSTMAAGLVRELIHDLLVMRSDFSRDRFPNENDAYYDKIYLRQDFSVRNNVDWGAGVPIQGAYCDNALLFGETNQVQMRGKYARLRWNMCAENVVFWFPLGFTELTSSDLPSAYIENDGKQGKIGMTIYKRKYREIRKNTCFEDLKAGRYCTTT